MPKKLETSTEKVTIRLFDGEKEVLNRFYPAIGYNAAIRTLVHRHVSKLLEQESRQGVINHGPTTDIDIDGAIAESAGGSDAG